MYYNLDISPYVFNYYDLHFKFSSAFKLSSFINHAKKEVNRIVRCLKKLTKYISIDKILMLFDTDFYKALYLETYNKMEYK